MEKIILADGTEKEVPTADEFKALDEKAKTADKFKADYDAANKELETFKNDPQNKNWQQARTTIDRLKDELKKGGKEMRDDGTIVEIGKTMTFEEVEAKATGAATKLLLEERKREKLSKFTEEDRKVIEHYYNKLSTGEDMSFEKVDKFVTEAARLVKPDMFVSPTPSGHAPRLPDGTKQNFAETDLGKQVAEDIFGTESFTKKK